jgi:WD40 repeat protein
LAFSPDGSQLAAPFGFYHAGADGVEVLDPESGLRLARLVTENEVRSVAFSPDGQLLAGGQLDGAAVLWATDDWGQVGPPLALRAGHPALGVAFSPDSSTLATSHDDGSVVLWDVRSPQPAGLTLPGPSGHWVTSRFTPDGRRLFAVYDNRRAIRWEVDPDAWRQHACTVAGGFTSEEWDGLVPGQDYVEVCPSG